MICYLSVMRLADGDSAKSGRVEIYHNGEWGTVCHNSWDNREARYDTKPITITVTAIWVKMYSCPISMVIVHAKLFSAHNDYALCNYNRSYRCT